MIDFIWDECFFIENNKIIFNDYLRASIQKEIIENKIDKKFTVKIIEYYEWIVIQVL